MVQRLQELAPAGRPRHRAPLGHPAPDPTAPGGPAPRARRRHPLVVNANLERPAILTPFAEFVATILTNVGASPAVLVDVLTGAVAPLGRLPFEVPRSTGAVQPSHSDVADDTEDRLYPHGAGLRYPCPGRRRRAGGRGSEPVAQAGQRLDELVLLLVGEVREQGVGRPRRSTTGGLRQRRTGSVAVSPASSARRGRPSQSPVTRHW